MFRPYFRIGFVISTLFVKFVATLPIAELPIGTSFGNPANPGVYPIPLTAATNSSIGVLIIFLPKF